MALGRPTDRGSEEERLSVLGGPWPRSLLGWMGLTHCSLSQMRRLRPEKDGGAPAGLRPPRPPLQQLPRSFEITEVGPPAPPLLSGDRPGLRKEELGGAPGSWVWDQRVMGLLPRQWGGAGGASHGEPIPRGAAAAP